MPDRSAIPKVPVGALRVKADAGGLQNRDEQQARGAPTMEGYEHSPPRASHCRAFVSQRDAATVWCTARRRQVKNCSERRNLRNFGTGDFFYSHHGTVSEPGRAFTRRRPLQHQWSSDTDGESC